MVNPEALPHEGLRRAHDRVLRCGFWHREMGREGDEPTRDAPYVQIVDRGDGRQLLKRRANLVDVNVTRRSLHEHGHRLLQE